MVNNSQLSDFPRRMTDATSEKELHKALSTYLNRTSAADYTLPKMTGLHIIQSNQKNMPTYKMREKTKLSWFPGRDIEFAGSDSPPSTVYSPNTDKPFPTQKFSVGRDQRFTKPSSVFKLH